MNRTLNALEQSLHQAALASADQTIPVQELDALAPAVNERNAALNFLLGTGMLKAKLNAKGTVIAFRAVTKQELDVKKDMTGEESMVLGYIEAAKDEGIWTKHLKAKTELHQTVIDRTLKSLLQKNLIKVVKSVKHPTRKIYMLANLTPSADMTGGPWFTDNELDTEFIKLLLEACAHYIRERTFPKQSSSSRSQPLHPPSHPPSYPTAQQIQLFLSKSGITDTQLSVEHVDMLCGVLVLDGLVERIPLISDGGTLWDEDEEVADDEGLGEDKKRRNPHAGSTEDERKPRKKRKANGADRDGTQKKGKSTVKTEDGYASDASDPEPMSLLTDTDVNTMYAYRAIRPEYPQSVLGWSQTPCGRCPVFDFCTGGGPVNPAECVYFDEIEASVLE